MQLSVAAPAPGQTVDDGHGLLVRGPDLTVYLLWHGQRLRVAVPEVLPALGYASVTPIAVGAGWLGVVPQGPDLTPLDVPQRGQRATTVDGREARIGQVFVAQAVGSDMQYYLMRAGGLAPVTPTDAALLLGDPDSVLAYPGGTVAAIPISAAAAAGASQGIATPRAGYPPSPPRLLSGSAAAATVCASYSPDAPAAVTMTVAASSVATGSVATGSLAAGSLAAGAGQAVTPPPRVDVNGGPVADQVAVPIGRAALVRAQAAPGVDGGTSYLVDDQGVKYPLNTPDVVTLLGYGGVAPIPLPAGLVQLLPTGPRLDPQDAAQTVPVMPGRSPPATGSG